MIINNIFEIKREDGYYFIYRYRVITNSFPTLAQCITFVVFRLQRNDDYYEKAI